MRISIVESKRKQVVRGRRPYLNLCSGFIVAMIAVFLFLLRYDVPFYGDDVGGLVANNPDSTYIDDRVVEGECVLDLDYSVRAAWDRLVYSYFMWNGRVTAKIVTPLIRVIFSLPDGINWMVFSLYITLFLLLLLLLTVQNICGSLREGMRNPVAILLAGILLFYIPVYSYAYMTRLIMYTFTNIYVVSVILYLAFYSAVNRAYAWQTGLYIDDHCYISRKSSNKTNSDTCLTIKALIGINILGLLAGLSHEAYGVIFGAVLLMQLIRFWLKNHRRISVRHLFMYVGYMVGFCICFSAPGNFNRAQQSHESALHSVPLLERLFNSIYIHAFVAYKIWIVPVIVLPLLIIFIAVLLRKKIVTWRDLLSAVINNLEWFFGFGMSAITWGLVARVVSYGMLAANVILIIGIFRVIRELWALVEARIMLEEGTLEKIHKVLAGLSVAVVVLLAVGSYSQMASAHEVASVWRENLRVARKAGMEEVMVPAYPENLDIRFYDLNAINSQSRYDKVACRVVYGTRVVIEEADD